MPNLPTWEKVNVIPYYGWFCYPTWRGINYHLLRKIICFWFDDQYSHVFNKNVPTDMCSIIRLYHCMKMFIFCMVFLYWTCKKRNTSKKQTSKQKTWTWFNLILCLLWRSITLLTCKRSYGRWQHTMKEYDRRTKKHSSSYQTARYQTITCIALTNTYWNSLRYLKVTNK